MIQRSWYATCSYPGLEEFIMGTVTTERSEGEEAARVKLAALAASILPPGLTISRVAPGSVIVVDEEGLA